MNCNSPLIRTPLSRTSVYRHICQGKTTSIKVLNLNTKTY